MYRLLAVLLFFLSVNNVYAKTLLTEQVAELSMILSADKGAEMQLQVWQQSLPGVLDKISQILNIPIHYSVLPEGKVKATCVSSTVKGLLNCLLGSEINVAFRYSKGTQDVQSVQAVTEIWVLGSSLKTSDATQQCVELIAPVNKGQNLVIDESKSKASLIKLEQLLAGATVENDEQRALAVAKLATKAVAGNEQVTEALMQALDDPSAKVRMQALFGWVFREGEAALPELARALDDPDPAVRKKAVGLGNNKDLLNQAASDPNPSVRTYALMKLQAKNRVSE